MHALSHLVHYPTNHHGRVLLSPPEHCHVPALVICFTPSLLVRNPIIFGFKCYKPTKKKKQLFCTFLVLHKAAASRQNCNPSVLTISMYTYTWPRIPGFIGTQAPKLLLSSLAKRACTNPINPPLRHKHEVTGAHPCNNSTL